MSKNAILTKFSMLDEKLCEENTSIISSVPLNEELSQLINNKYLEKIKVIESNRKDSYIQEIISIKDNGEYILQLIDKKIQFLANNDALKETKNRMLNDLTIFLNFRKIYLLKKENYPNDNNVILIIG